MNVICNLQLLYLFQHINIETFVTLLNAFNFFLSQHELVFLYSLSLFCLFPLPSSFSASMLPWKNLHFSFLILLFIVVGFFSVTCQSFSYLSTPLFLFFLSSFVLSILSSLQFLTFISYLFVC